MEEARLVLTLVLPIDGRILGLGRLLLLIQIVVPDIFLFLRHDCTSRIPLPPFISRTAALIYNFRSRPRPVGTHP